MRKLLLVLISIILLGTMASCDRTGAGGSSSGGSFPGKIAIVTNTVDQNEEEFRSAEALVHKYGADKVIHRTWPVNFGAEGEQMITTMREIANDPEVGAIIINQAVINTNAAIDAVRQMRRDIFIVSASPAEDPAQVAARVDLALDVDNLVLGEPLVMQAKAQGAQTIVHYSFPRHMGVPQLAWRRDVMRETAIREGLRFEELTTPDPLGDGGQSATEMHIMQDLPRAVQEYGVNTAFFGTNCAMQTPIITQVLATGAIYPQPCCPSPYHGFPGTLGITDRIPSGEFTADGQPILTLRNISEVVDETRRAITQRGMAGRLSTWAVPASMMWTTIGAEYAIAWLNGQAPRELGVIDLNLLNRLAEEYTESLYGEPMGVAFNHFTLDGQTYNHYILGLVNFLTY